MPDDASRSGRKLVIHVSFGLEGDMALRPEEAVAAGHVSGYGIATWAGSHEEVFTVEELLTMAAEAAGGTAHHWPLPRRRSVW